MTFTAAMKLVRVPRAAKLVYPSIVWRMPADKKVIYLTFDDGPDPYLTPQVLDMLSKFNAKATFFCTGGNVLANPKVFKAVVEAGHAVGNHGYEHMNGWKTGTDAYIENVDKADKYIGSTLFRPPYGKMRTGQIRVLKKKYTLVGWSVMCYDFDMHTTKEQCLDNIIRNVSNGSIVVMHDNPKSAANMLYALPRVLEHFSGLGFEFESIKL